MRIISSRDPLFDPSGYHFGSVWPLFTGWAAVGEYRYHRPLAGYANLMANSLLTLDAPLGHTTEVLSGAYNDTLSTGSPHQIWSSAMVVSPLLRGMMGLDADAANHKLTFAPHVPADWNEFRLHNVHVGQSSCDLHYTSTDSGERTRSSNGEVVKLEAKCSGPDVAIDFAPSFSPRARVTSGAVNGSAVQPRINASSEDQHALLSVHTAASLVTATLNVADDFGIALPLTLPLPGQASQNLKTTSETWSADRNELVLEFSGLSGREYRLPVRGAPSGIDVRGAQFDKTSRELLLLVRFPAGQQGYQHARVTLRFPPRR
jgi:hypothetical protein